MRCGAGDADCGVVGCGAGEAAALKAVAMGRCRFLGLRRSVPSIGAPSFAINGLRRFTKFLQDGERNEIAKDMVRKKIADKYVRRD